MGYNSDNYEFFDAKVDRTFLKVRVKSLVKVTRIVEVIGRKRPPTLRKLNFKLGH